MPAACLNRAAESLRLAQVLRGALPGYPWRLSPHQWKVLNAILRCRTPELGGHLYHCADCGGGHFVPHSCRNRHCPQCQKAQCIQWLEKQSQALLPVPYFHVVFTLPHDLNALIAQNQTAIYNLLFAAASATLLKFGEHRLKARIGVTAVLHTWSQTLLDHYQHRTIIPYQSEAPRDFEVLKNAITKRIKALLQRSAAIRQIKESDPVAPVEGLSQPELVVLATVAGSIMLPEDGVSAFVAKGDVEKAGFTALGFSIGLRRLRAKDFLTLHEATDYSGEAFQVIKITESGWSWIEANEDKFMLRRPEIGTDDNSPF